MITQAVRESIASAQGMLSHAQEGIAVLSDWCNEITKSVESRKARLSGLQDEFDKTKKGIETINKKIKEELAFAAKAKQIQHASIMVAIGFGGALLLVMVVMLTMRSVVIDTAKSFIARITM